MWLGLVATKSGEQCLKDTGWRLLDAWTGIIGIVGVDDYEFVLQRTNTPITSPELLSSEN